MKATGIVRRIDELGRIVVPKEIRRVLGSFPCSHRNMSRRLPQALDAVYV